MPYTNFPYGITSQGVPILGGGGIAATPGKSFFVDYTNGNDSSNIVRNTKQRGRSMDLPFKTIEYALTKVTSNAFDVIYLIGNATHQLSAMLDISKSRVGIMGLDMSGGRAYGAAAKISLPVTTAVTDIAAIKNTGVRNVFRNVKVISNNTLAQSLYGMIDGGEYTQMDSVEVYKSTDMDVTGAADMVCNADSPIYRNCTFGSLATARVGAVIRAALLMTKGIAGSGLVSRDVLMQNCNFWINASDVANRFIYGANADDIERAAILEYCRFINNGLSASVPAQNVAFGASLTAGAMLLNRCTSLNANTAMSTTTGVFVDGGPPTAATTGISVQAA